jgi:HAMP domain-containing protein
MNDTSGGHEDLASEFRRLGRNLQEALQAAWDSDERRRLETEIETGLHEAAQALKGAAHTFSDTPAGQQLRQELKDLEQRVRSGELQTKARQDVVSGLRALNAELERAAQNWKSKSGGSTDDRV